MSQWDDDAGEFVDQIALIKCRQCLNPNEKGVCTCGREKNWAAGMGFGDGGDSYESFKKRLDRLEALVRELMEKEKP